MKIPCWSNNTNESWEDYVGITLSWYIWCATWPPKNVLELTNLPNFRMTVGVALFEVCLSDCSLETGKCLLKEFQHFYPVSFKQIYIVAARLKGQLLWYPRISFFKTLSPCYMPCTSLHLGVFGGKPSLIRSSQRLTWRVSIPFVRWKTNCRPLSRRKQFRIGRTKKA